jgi:hypothetical protein
MSIKRPGITQVPCEGLTYEGHIVHVLLTPVQLIVSILTTDRDLGHGYLADFRETEPGRIQDLVERILRNCQGAADGLNESLLGQPVQILRKRGRLQIRSSSTGKWEHVPGMEFTSENYSEELLKEYPMLRKE